MPESAEQVHARVVAAVGEAGRLPMPPVHEWDVFPWEVVDGELVPKVVSPPSSRPEPARAGAGGIDCISCTDGAGAVVVWRNERWVLRRPKAPSGLPLVLWLVSTSHLDYPDMDDELAGEYGRISARLCRIMSELPNIGRVHVCRWGDGTEHLHVWFIARTARLPNIIGSMAVEWDEMLPAVPEEIWLDDVRAVARSLAEFDGVATV